MIFLVLFKLVGSLIGDGISLTPPLEWRSWNQFGGDVTQAGIELQVRALVGVKRMIDGKLMSLYDVGFRTVGLDDGYQVCKKHSVEEGPRSHDKETGFPIINKRFPDMRKMVRMAHSLGVKMGWYFNNCICKEVKRGTHELKYYQGDVKMTVDFEFDAVKLDNCGDQTDIDLYMNLFNKTGRRIEIEGCYWGEKVGNATWCPGHFFRASSDIDSNYGSMLSCLRKTLTYIDVTRPGCWAYADMLEIGVGNSPFKDSHGEGFGLTSEENRQHFASWAIISSPLVLSHDLSDESQVDKLWPLIANPEIIAVNQAWYKHAGGVFKRGPGDKIKFEVLWRRWHKPDEHWPAYTYLYKPIGPDSAAVLLMNMQNISTNLSLHVYEVPGFENIPFVHVRDIFKRRDVAHDVNFYECVKVRPRDCCFLLLSRMKRKMGTGEFWNIDRDEDEFQNRTIEDLEMEILELREVVDRLQTGRNVIQSYGEPFRINSKSMVPTFSQLRQSSNTQVLSATFSFITLLIFTRIYFGGSHGIHATWKRT